MQDVFWDMQYWDEDKRKYMPAPGPRQHRDDVVFRGISLAREHLKQWEGSVDGGYGFTVWNEPVKEWCFCWAEHFLDDGPGFHISDSDMGLFEGGFCSSKAEVDAYALSYNWWPGGTDEERRDYKKWRHWTCVTFLGVTKEEYFKRCWDAVNEDLAYDVIPTKYQLQDILILQKMEFLYQD